MIRFGIPLALFAVLFGAWETACQAGWWSPLVLPPPSLVAVWLVKAASDGTLAAATWITMRRLLVGYATGIVVGIPLGLAAARVRALSSLLGVVALGLQTLPSVCWAPLAILWFGQTELAMQFVVLMGTVWSILLATEGAIRNIPPVYFKAARTLGSRGFHTITRVIIPAALPGVISGLKQGWAFAWRSLMAAEIFITIITGYGLGHLLHYGRELHAMDQVLGVMAAIMLTGYLADRLMFFPVERWLRHRWGLAA